MTATRNTYYHRVSDTFNTQISRTPLRIMAGVYHGFVVDDNDPDQKGRVRVHVPGLHTDVDPSGDNVTINQPVDILYPGAIWCRVGIPMGGTAPTKSGGQRSYGLNGFRPKKDNEVLVAFGSDHMSGVVFAILPDIDKADNSALGPSVGKSSDGTVGMVDEISREDRYGQPPPLHPIQNALVRQGLDKDRIRGLNFAKLSRDPSPRAMGLTSPEGSSIIIDDGDGENQSGAGIRIRTANGGQILIDDVAGMIYLVNNHGTAWVEMNRNGDLDAFAATSINFTTLGDMNFTTGGEFNVHAGGSINMYTESEEGMKLDATKGPMDIYSKGTMRHESEENMHVRARGNYTVTNKLTYINGSTKAERATRRRLQKIPGNRVYTEKITKRVPEQEPWAGHLDVSILDTGSASGAASIEQNQTYYYGTPSNPIGYNDQTGDYDLMNYPEASAQPGALITYEPNVDRRIHGGLVSILNSIAQEFGRPLHVISGYRSPTYNAKVGGARRSQHMLGRAVDIRISTLSTAERLRLIALASKMGVKGIGIYNNSLHLDIRDGQASYWGPSFTAASTPAYASRVLQQHAAGAFG